MNRHLEATAISKYEKAIKISLETAVTSGDLVTAMQAFDETMQNDRLKQAFHNVTQTGALSSAEAVLVQAALESL